MPSTTWPTESESAPSLSTSEIETHAHGQHRHTGPDRVAAPIRIDGPSRRCREEWPAERMHQDGYWKDLRQIAHEARPRLLFVELATWIQPWIGNSCLLSERNYAGKALRIRSRPWPRSWADWERQVRFALRRMGRAFSSVFDEAPLGQLLFRMGLGYSVACAFRVGAVSIA